MCEMRGRDLQRRSVDRMHSMLVREILGIPVGFLCGLLDRFVPRKLLQRLK